MISEKLKHHSFPEGLIYKGLLAIVQLARHEASFFKLVEWSEQFRPVTSVRLGTVHRRVQIWLCTEQRV